jgi:hypothetical protein
MSSTVQPQTNELFSASNEAREVELSFMNRLVHYVGKLNVANLHQLAVSGKFVEAFPAIDDESTPAVPRRFGDLRPFDYTQWAKREDITG